MKHKLMRRGALLGAAVLLVTACFTDKDYASEYTTQVLVRFEPDYDYQWDQFSHDFFNDGADTVSVHENFSVGPVYHFAKLDADNGFLGGIVLARGRDTDAAPDRKPSRFAVYDGKYGNKESKVYAVFHDTTDVLMPEYTIQIYIPNIASSCTASVMYVHNVQAAVQAAMHGVGLEGGAFQAGDHLTLTVIGILNSAETARKDVKLIDGTQVVSEWKEVDLAALGKVDAVNLRLTSSRPDFPLYCCLDDMGYVYKEIYQ